MSLLTRRTQLIGLSFLVAIGACVLHWSSSTNAAAPATQPSATELAKVQQEEIDTLHQAADLATQLFSRGMGPEEDIDRLNEKLTEARLRMATSAQDREGVLRDALAAAKAQEALASERFRAGLVSDVAPLEAKAYRLSIEEKMVEAGIGR